MENGKSAGSPRGNRNKAKEKEVKFQNRFTKYLSDNKRIPVNLIEPLITKMRDPIMGILSWRGVAKPPQQQAQDKSQQVAQQPPVFSDLMFIDWAEQYWEPTHILTPPQFIIIFKLLENHPEGLISVAYGDIAEDMMGLSKYILKPTYVLNPVDYTLVTASNLGLIRALATKSSTYDSEYIQIALGHDDIINTQDILQSAVTYHKWLCQTDLSKEQRIVQETRIVNFIKFILRMRPDLHEAQQKAIASTVQYFGEYGISLTLEVAKVVSSEPPPTLDVYSKRGDETWQLVKFPIEELARQMTIRDQNLQKAIPKKEYVNFSWREFNTPNITAYLDYTESLVYWFAALILEEENSKGRVKVMGFLIDLGLELIRIRNYQSSNAIRNALYLPCVQKLKKAWKLLSQSRTATENWRKLSLFFSKSRLVNDFEKYYSILQHLSLDTPVIVLQDALLQKIIDGRLHKQPDFLDAPTNTVMNLAKVEQRGKFLSEAYKYKVEFAFHYHPDIQSVLTSIPYVEDTHLDKMVEALGDMGADDVMTKAILKTSGINYYDEEESFDGNQEVDETKVKEKKFDTENLNNVLDPRGKTEDEIANLRTELINYAKEQLHYQNPYLTDQTCRDTLIDLLTKSKNRRNRFKQYMDVQFIGNIFEFWTTAQTIQKGVTRYAVVLGIMHRYIAHVTDAPDAPNPKRLKALRLVPQKLIDEIVPTFEAVQQQMNKLDQAFIDDNPTLANNPKNFPSHTAKWEEENIFKGIILWCYQYMFSTVYVKFVEAEIRGPVYTAIQDNGYAEFIHSELSQKEIVIIIFVQPGKASYVFMKEWDRVYQKALEKKILVLGIHSGYTNPNKFCMSALKITWDVDADIIVDAGNLIAKELEYSLNDKKECSPGVVLRAGKKNLYMWNSFKDMKKNATQASYPDPLDIWNFIALQKNTPKPDSVKFGNPENLIGWSDSNRDQGARAVQGGLTRVKDIVAKTQGLSKKNAETKLETAEIVQRIARQIKVDLHRFKTPKRKIPANHQGMPVYVETIKKKKKVKVETNIGKGKQATIKVEDEAKREDVEDIATFYHILGKIKARKGFLNDCYEIDKLTTQISNSKTSSVSYFVEKEGLHHLLVWAEILFTNSQASTSSPQGDTQIIDSILGCMASILSFYEGWQPLRDDSTMTVRLLDLFQAKSTHFSARLLMGKMLAHSLPIKGVIQVVTQGYKEYAVTHKEGEIFETFLSMLTQSWITVEFVAIAMKIVNFIANGLESIESRVQMRYNFERLGFGELIKAFQINYVSEDVLQQIHIWQHEVDLDMREIKTRKLNIVIKDGMVAYRDRKASEGRGKRGSKRASTGELNVKNYVPTEEDLANEKLGKKGKRKSLPYGLSATATTTAATTTGSDHESGQQDRKVQPQQLPEILLPTTAVTVYLDDGAKVSFIKSPKPLKAQIDKICSTRGWDLEEYILVDEENNVVDLDVTCAQLNYPNVYLKKNTGHVRPYAQIPQGEEKLMATSESYLVSSTADKPRTNDERNALSEGVAPDEMKIIFAETGEQERPVQPNKVSATASAVLKIYPDDSGVSADVNPANRVYPDDTGLDSSNEI